MKSMIEIIANLVFYVLISFHVNAQNYFAGSNAGAGNTGINNTAVGGNSLRSTNSGVWNTALGCSTLFSNKTGNHNVAVGYGALYFNVSGGINMAVGSQAMFSNVSGNYNTAVGNYSLTQNTTGTGNVALGSYSGYNNASGDHNVSVGNYALYLNTNGGGNTAMGSKAMYSANGSTFNSAFGYGSLYSNTSGNSNTAIGRSAMYSNTTGSGNVALGSSAADTYTNYSQCTFLGSSSDASVSGLVNATAIGNGAKVNASNKVVIGNTDVTSIGGQVGWTTYSDSRLKFYIRKSTLGLDFIKALNPVTYQYTADGQKEILYTGLIAQEVAEAAGKAGVAFSAVDKNGEYWGIRYGELTVPLIKAVQEMEEKYQNRIAQLEASITRLETALESKDRGAAFLSGRAILFHPQPDPVTAGTFIRFHLPETDVQAEMVIRDLNGKTLRNISLAGEDKGRISLQPDSLSAGTYTYSLICDGVCIDTKLMVITR